MDVRAFEPLRPRKQNGFAKVASFSAKYWDIGAEQTRGQRSSPIQIPTWTSCALLWEQTTQGWEHIAESRGRTARRWGAARPPSKSRPSQRDGGRDHGDGTRRIPEFSRGSRVLVIFLLCVDVMVALWVRCRRGYFTAILSRIDHIFIDPPNKKD